MPYQSLRSARSGLCCRRRFRLRPDQFYRSARLFDSRRCRLRCPMDLERHRRLQLAIGEQLHAVPLPADHTGGFQGNSVDRRLGVELAGIDRLLNAAEADLIIVLGKDVVEAALGQAAVERHLPALETFDGHPGARLLSLDAAPGGLALARADAATDPH